MPRSKWRPCKARRRVRFPAVGSPLAPGGPASHLALKRTSTSLSDELPCQTTRCRELSAVNVFVAETQKAIGGSPLSTRISLTRKSSVVLGTTCTCHSGSPSTAPGHEIARRLSRPSNRRLLPPGDGTQASVKGGTSSGVQKAVSVLEMIQINLARVRRYRTAGKLSIPTQRLRRSEAVRFSSARFRDRRAFFGAGCGLGDGDFKRRPQRTGQEMTARTVLSLSPRTA
jgi:hypothetical protein